MELVGDGGMVEGVGGSEVLMGDGATLLATLPLRWRASDEPLPLAESPVEAESEVDEEEDLGGSMARLNRSITTS